LKKIIVIICFIALPLYGRNLSENEKKIQNILNDQTEDRKLSRDTTKTTKTLKKNPQASVSININSEDMILLKTGIQFYNSGLLTHAKKKFNEIVTKYKSSPYVDQSKVWIGKILIGEYKYKDAAAILKTVSKTSGEYPASLYLLANTSLRLGNRINAIALYNIVSSRFPQHDLADDALYNMARILYQDKKGPQALPIAIKIIKYYKNRETVDDAFYLLAKIFELDPVYQDPETARAIYQNFIKRSSDGQKFFHKSPLLKRVKRDLRILEKTHFRLEY